MSWDAYLETDGCAELEWWNYTHNTNAMIEAVVGDAIAATPEPFWSALGNDTMGRGAWWMLLDGLSGQEGAELLDRIASGLAAQPERFRAMNPPNGWGDYDRLLAVLREMCAAGARHPAATWRTSG